MPTFRVRKNCEYSIDVEAESEEKALDKALYINIQEWDSAWSDMEIDTDE